MGIKGIYREIGPGERIALCKLAIEHLENTGRPFRLAIDFSIWQFQVQAAKGGSNPAIRTLFYRLVRLQGLAIQPIFVFDGPNKPAFKRNRRSSGRGDCVATAMAKRLIGLFGFAMHDAPGEAEAECALLQQQGAVDAVLSEDVDTIMFGCRRTLRNWTAEGSKGPKIPTHVSMYEVGEVSDRSTVNGKGISGLNREGMVLVALMSGGDYLPEGVPGCGVKTACEAARAGFGRDLCRLKRADKEGLAQWKKRFLHELRTNESGFFRTKHKALEIPEDFPSNEILRYYTHPVVSKQETVDRVREKFTGTQQVDVLELRKFVQETFDWTYRTGAVKLIRVLAPSLLVQQLLQRMTSQETPPANIDLMQAEESAIVKAITNRREHFSTDATPELRISFVPADIVGLDLGVEVEAQPEAFGRTGIALNSDDEFDEDVGEELGDEQKSTGGKKYDPLQPELVWIPESVVKLGVPLAAELFDEKQRAKAVQAAARAAKKPRAKKTDMQAGALDKYITTTKTTNTATTTSKRLGAPMSTMLGSSATALPAFLSTQDVVRPQHARAMTTKASLPTPESRSSKPPKKSSKPQATKPTAGVNPWTIAGSQISPRVTKSFTTSSTRDKSGFAGQPILIMSSPVPAPASPPRNTGLMSATIPTRSKRTQTPPIETSFSSEPFSPSPSLRKLKSPVLTTTRTFQKKPSASPPPQNRKPRPFKRTNSGAEEGVGVGQNLIKKSITSYAKVVKGAGFSPSAGVKTTAAVLPIELPSEDDDDDGNVTLPSIEAFSGRKKASLVPSFVGITRGPFELSDEEDPFVSPPPLPRTFSQPRSKSLATSSSTLVGLAEQNANKKGNPKRVQGGNNYSFSSVTVKGNEHESTAQYRRSRSRETRENTLSTASKTTIKNAPHISIGYFHGFGENNDESDDDPFRSDREDEVSSSKPFETNTSLTGKGASTDARGRQSLSLAKTLQDGRGNDERWKQKPTWRLSEIAVVDLTGED